MTSSATHTIERPPIIAVLGHVDHGKSTLLDYIRKSNVVEGEAGGITQHAAAYEVTHADKEGAEKRITFIDTPGHAAFKTIRARGASIADIAILVVSAEDGVKAQTLEALESIKASGIPFVIAINKIDKPNADIEQTKMALLEHQIYLEGLGGDIPWVPISAKSGEGVPELLDMLLLVAELEELTGNPEAPAEGYVMEAHRDPKRGIAATLIITNGTLTSGSAVLAGGAIAPVRIMEDHAGITLQEATFSTPITIVGFDTLPSVGAPFHTFTTKREAENARSQESHAPTVHTQETADSDDLFCLPLIVKADVAGSLEAVVAQLQTVGDEFARVRIIHSGIGPVSEGDVKHALASSLASPIIVGFGVEADPSATELARQNEIRIETFDIIYNLTERIEELLKESAPKRTVRTVTGAAKILKYFSGRKDEHVIGGEVREGTLTRGSRIELVRQDTVVAEGTIGNMQTNKQDVAHVDADMQFGAQVTLKEAPRPGDVIRGFIEEEV